MKRAILTALKIEVLNDDDADLSYLDQFENATDETERQYYIADQKRKDSYGYSWNMIGIKAVATIHIPFEVCTSKGMEINYKIQEIDSGGLWSIESDSDKGYLKQVAKEQVDELKDFLKTLKVKMEYGIRLFPNSDTNKEVTKSFDELAKSAIESM